MAPPHLTTVVILRNTLTRNTCVGFILVVLSFLYGCIGRDGVLKDGVDRFITTVSVAQNSPVSNSSELLQVFFWSPRAPSHSHCIWSLVYRNSLSLVLYCPLFSPPRLFSCYLPQLFPPMLMASAIMSLYRSLHLSFTHTLSLTQPGCQSHAVILNDSLSSISFLLVLTPLRHEEKAWTHLTLWEKNIFNNQALSIVYMDMSFILSLRCLKLVESLTE